MIFNRSIYHSFFFVIMDLPERHMKMFTREYYFFFHLPQEVCRHYYSFFNTRRHGTKKSKKQAKIVKNAFAKKNEAFKYVTLTHAMEYIYIIICRKIFSTLYLFLYSCCSEYTYCYCFCEIILK